MTAILLALGYSVFGEWLNTHIRPKLVVHHSRARFTASAPALTPLLQWLVVPGLAFAIIACQRGRGPVR